MVSKYPDDIDTDAELPRIDDNVSEIGSEALNAMREAIFAIQETLGTNPQGATADLVSRLSASINDDGTLKASALLAAGLVALPITNAQIGASAAIEEGKLDLDVATQTLQDQITSNDVDIAELQKSVADLLNKFNRHINGLGFRHTTAHIDLATTLTSIVATDLDTALVAINDRFLDHVDTTKVGAHQASNISVDTTGLEVVGPSSDDVQSAIEDLDNARDLLFRVHRDDMHANGFSNWSNDRDGYNVFNQKFPASATQPPEGFVVSGTRNAFEFDGYGLAGLNVRQGDILVIDGGALAGQYVIDDVGPRSTVGTKPALASDQLEIAGTFADGYAAVPVRAFVFGRSSVDNIKTNVAPTIHQSDIRVDSIQVSRPNAAKVLSLGITPKLIDSTHTLAFEVGVGVGDGYRQITIDNLNFNRLGSPAPVVTVDTIVERINDVLQNRTDGYAFPAAAYRVGDELMLAHNWIGDESIYFKVLPSGTGNFVLGLDGYGADVVGREIFPTQTNYFYVGGRRFSDVATILQTTADVVGTTFTMPTGVNPLSAGVKRGHILHLRTHANTSEVGTYFITDITSTTITIHKVAGITAQNDVEIEIYHDVLPLDDFSSNLDNQVIEAFLTSQGTFAYNERVTYTDNINNLTVVGVSDNFLPDVLDLVSTSSGGSTTLQLGDGNPVTVPNSFSGQVKVFARSNVEWITVALTSVVGVGTNAVTINEHVNEEEFLEVCSVRLDGALTASDITDKRLFGTTGIDEIREDFIQAYIETPLDELRSDGVVRGFDLLRDIDGDLLGDGYFDPSLYPNNQGVVVRGGTAYVSGVRCDVVTTGVPFPNVAGTYTLALNEIGTYQIIDTADYSLTEVLDGYAGTVIPIATVVHNGSVITSAEDRRFFLNDLDDKVELILDLTNRMIGTFASVEAALGWIESYPFQEKFKIRLVSNKPADITVRNIGRDLTIALDGKVRNLTLDNPCRLVSDSLADRGFNHVDGYLTLNSGCTEFEADGLSLSGVNLNLASGMDIAFRRCYFDGYGSADGLVTNSSGGSYSTISFAGCVFDSTSNLSISATSGNMFIDNCRFAGSDSQIAVAGNSVAISNSKFTGKGIDIVSGSSSEALISNCSFIDVDTSATLLNAINSANGSVTISNCAFNSCATNGNTETLIRLQGSEGNSVSNCRFIDCSVNANDQLMNIEGTVNECSFASVTFPTNQGITAERFTGNAVIGTAASMLVGAREFTNNSGCNAVASKSASEELRIVSHNIFGNSSQGFNVDLTALDNDDDCVVDANVFDIGGTTTMNAITFTSTNPDVVISDNAFAGDSGDVAVALASADGIVISGNKFDTLDAVSTSAQVNEITMAGNQLESSDLAMQIGNNVVFADNIISDGSQTFSGSISVNNFRMTGNTFDSSASPSITVVGFVDSVISENHFDNNLTLNLSSSISSSILSHNTGGFVISTTYDASNCVFNGNIVSFATINNITWDNSFITNNIFTHTANTEFTLDSTGGGVDANVLIQENIFNSSGSTAVQISSTDPVRSFYFSENVNDSGSPATVVFNSNINEAIVEGNFDFSIDVANGSNSSIIAGNMMPNADTVLSGTCNSTIIASNFIQDLDIECNSTGGLIVQNNYVTSNLDILSSVSGNLDITNAFVINNYAIGDITTLSDITDGLSVLSLTGTAFSTNLCTNMRLMDVSNGTGITSSYTFEQNIFTLNNIKVDCEIFNTAQNFADSAGFSFDRNVFNGNTIDGYMSFLMSSASSPAERVCESTTVSANTIGEQLQFDGDVSYSGLFVSNNEIELGISLTVPNSQAFTNSQLEFFGNKLNGNFEYVIQAGSGVHTLNDFVFSNNTLPDNELIIESSAASAQTIAPFAANRVNISNNFLQRVLFSNDSVTPGGFYIINFETGLIAGNFFTSAGTSGGVRVSNTVGSGIFFFQSTFTNWGVFNNFSIGSILSGGEAEISFNNVHSGAGPDPVTTIAQSIIANNSPFTWRANSSVFFQTGVFSNNQCREWIDLDFDSFLISGNLIQANCSAGFVGCQLIGNGFRDVSGTFTLNSFGTTVLIGNNINHELDTSPVSSSTLIDSSFIGNTFQSGDLSFAPSGVVENVIVASNVFGGGTPEASLSLSGSFQRNVVVSNNIFLRNGITLSSTSLGMEFVSINGNQLSDNANPGDADISVDSAAGLFDSSIQNNRVNGAISVSVAKKISSTTINGNGTGGDLSVTQSSISFVDFMKASSISNNSVIGSLNLSLFDPIGCQVVGNNVFGDLELYCVGGSALSSYSSNNVNGDLTVNVPVPNAFLMQNCQITNNIASSLTVSNISSLILSSVISNNKTGNDISLSAEDIVQITLTNNSAGDNILVTSTDLFRENNFIGNTSGEDMTFTCTSVSVMENSGITNNVVLGTLSVDNSAGTSRRVVVNNNLVVENIDYDVNVMDKGAFVGNTVEESLTLTIQNGNSTGVNIVSNNVENNITIDMTNSGGNTNFVISENYLDQGSGGINFLNTSTGTYTGFVISNNIGNGNISLPATGHTLNGWNIVGNNLGDLNFGSGAATINNMRLVGNNFDQVTVLSGQFSPGTGASVWFANHVVTWTTNGTGDLSLNGQDAIIPLGNTSNSDPGAGSRITNGATANVTVDNINEFTGNITAGGSIVIT